MPRGMYAKGLFIGAEIAFEKRNCLVNNCQQVFMNEELIVNSLGDSKFDTEAKLHLT